MSITIVRLGSPRGRDEGVRIGTVRRPPRGVPKSEFAARDYYDVWMPMLSPTVELMAQAKAADTSAQWDRFQRRFRAQMSEAAWVRESVPAKRKELLDKIQLRAFEAVPYAYFGQYSPAYAARKSLKHLDAYWSIPNLWVLDR